MSRKQRRVFLPALVVVVAISGALVFVAARTMTERKAASSSTLPAKASGAAQNPARPSVRNRSLQPEAFNAARRLGPRFAPGRREQSVLLGTLTMGSDRRVVRIARRQTDDGEQVEINLNGSQGALTWEAGTGALSSGARAGGAERELIERLVFDSPDQFVLAQMRGASYYTVATNVRPAEAGDGYTGPLWNIVRLDDPQSDETRRPESRWRLYYLNTGTGLVDKIVCQLRGETIEVAITGWLEQGGEQIPSQITWSRSGQTLMQYQLTNFSHGQQ